MSVLIVWYSHVNPAFVTLASAGQPAFPQVNSNRQSGQSRATTTHCNIAPSYCSPISITVPLRYQYGSNTVNYRSATVLVP